MFGGEDDERLPAEEKPDRIRELVEALPPEAEGEATTVIEDAENADEVITELEQIIAAHSPESADDAVSQAESLVHLSRMLAADGSITSWVETRVEGLTGDQSAQLREAIANVPEPVESEADDLVEQADDADTLTAELTELTEKHYQQEANQVVTEADSVSDLASTLEPDRDSADTEDEGDSLVGTLRERTGRGVKEAQTTMKNAEPEEAAMWGLLAGAAVMHPALGAPAIAAETSTAALLGVSAVGGGTLGAYASSHEDSLLADIEPTELLLDSKQMAAQTKDIEEIDGRTVGAALGASSHLSDVLTPAAYSQWIAHADADAIAEGAALGAKHARRKELGMSSRAGTVAGAGFGLLYSYLDGGDSEEQLRRVLADDLWQEYQHELER
jgi:hypothetical protein